MLADNMKELRLAGERFIKVEDWQNDELLPKYIDIPAGTRAQPCVYDGSTIFATSRSPEAHKHVRVFGIGKWINKTSQPYVKDGEKTYIVDAINGIDIAWYYYMPGTGSKDSEEAGRQTIKGVVQVLASQIKIGGGN